jgi:hypothetical protein
MLHQYFIERLRQVLIVLVCDEEASLVLEHLRHRLFCVNVSL